MNYHTLRAPIAAAVLLLGATGCTTEPKLPTIGEMTSGQIHSELVDLRGEDRVCDGDSGECAHWVILALHCERQYNGISTGYDQPCGDMEDLREQLTGIDLSSAPGAYNF